MEIKEHLKKKGLLVLNAVQRGRMKTGERLGEAATRRPAVLLSKYPGWPEHQAGVQWELVEILHIAERYGQSFAGGRLTRGQVGWEGERNRGHILEG